MTSQSNGKVRQEKTEGELEKAVACDKGHHKFKERLPNFERNFLYSKERRGVIHLNTQKQIKKLGNNKFSPLNLQQYSLLILI